MSPASKVPEVIALQQGLVTPTALTERMEILDVLRGFAILGILLVNMGAYNSPWIYLMNADVAWWTSGIDRLAEGMIQFVAQGKFYSLFSFLFGLGFAIQMIRAEARGAGFVPLYRRRLLALLMIGLLHAFLLWYGDILNTYALLGFLLFLFRKRQPKTILRWAVGLLILNAGVFLLFLFLMDPAQMQEGFRLAIDSSVKAYAHGSWADSMVQRAGDAMFIIFGGLIGAGPSIFAMFLLGLYAGKRDFFRNPTEHLPLVRKLNRWGLALGLVGNTAFVVGFELAEPMVVSLPGILSALGMAVGVPALFTFYVTAIVLLYQRPAWKRRLNWLAPVGRMALTNYLLQSVVCTMIFYNYGLGYYGKVGPALGLVFTAVIYLLQIPLSILWLKHFRFGPMEWFWRSLTYGKLQPLRNG